MLLCINIQYDPRAGVRSLLKAQEDKKRGTDMGDSANGMTVLQLSLIVPDDLRISPVLSLEGVHKGEENYLRGIVCSYC